MFCSKSERNTEHFPAQKDARWKSLHSEKAQELALLPDHFFMNWVFLMSFNY